MEQRSKKKTAKPYSSEFRARAVGLAMEHRDEDQSEAAALTAIAGELGCAAVGGLTVGLTGALLGGAGVLIARGVSRTRIWGRAKPLQGGAARRAQYGAD